MARQQGTHQPAQQPPFVRGGFLSRLGWGRTSETLAQHNRHFGVAATREVKVNLAQPSDRRELTKLGAR